MKIETFYLCVVVCLASLVGCGVSHPPASQQGEVVITSGNFDRIVGMQWILQKMTIDGSEYRLASEKPFIEFEAGAKFNGFASLNRFFGTLEIDSDGLVAWPKAFGATRMAGPEKLMTQEGNFLTALLKTEQANLGKKYLSFQTKDGKTKLIFLGPIN